MTDADEIVRTLEIRAPRETVFRYFTDPARWAAWWGEGSSVDPRPGGKVLIRYPNGATASGSVREISPPATLRLHVRQREPSGPDSVRRLHRDHPARGVGRAGRS